MGRIKKTPPLHTHTQMTFELKARYAVIDLILF